MRIDTLDNLNVNETGIVIGNEIMGDNRQNVINLGFSNGSRVKCLYFSPFGDPVAYLVKDVIIALRQEDSKNIIVMRDSDGSY